MFLLLYVKTVVDTFHLLSILLFVHQLDILSCIAVVFFRFYILLHRHCQSAIQF